MSFVSPGITVRELELVPSSTISSENVGVISIAATQGPVNQLTNIKSETELVSIFGKPTEYNYESWFSAVQYLAYGGTVSVIRPADSSNTVGLKNANTDNLNNVFIENDLDYLTNETSPSYKFAAKTPGSIFNKLKIVAVDHGADQILTISGATSDTTKLNVTSSAGFSANDIVKVDNEYLTVSSVATGQLTVVGGALGSVATGHSSGANVTKWSFTESATTTTLNEPDESSELTSTEKYITVSSVTGFAVNDYVKIKRVPVGGTAGTTFEYVLITDIDSDSNILIVNRGQLGTPAISFDDDVVSPESSVVVSVIKMTFAASTPVTTLSSDYPSYSVSTFTGSLGGIVKSGSKNAWVYSVVNDKINVILENSTERFVVGETLYNENGTSSIGTITNVSDYYDTLEYSPGLYWSSIASQPGTSGFALQRNASFDEFHLLILDENGTITGTPKTILERHTHLSKSNDGKSADGEFKYWKKVLETKSQYIYAGNNFVSTSKLSLTPIPNSNKTSVSVDNNTLNSLFDIFKSNNKPVLSFDLNNGSDYLWQSQSNVIETALTNAYDLLSESELFSEIEFLIPGSISLNKAKKLIQIVENRKDCIAVISPLKSDVINSLSTIEKTNRIINFFSVLPSSSYTIFDSGYKYIFDKYNDTYRYIPCASDVAGLCIGTTINSETWYSPAGYNRGNIKNSLRLAYNPKKSERDRLYSARINPIISVPGQGIILFGDKTALTNVSSFDRINVRRLFIELEKVISNLSKFQLFEVNDSNTRESFISTVEPYLRDVQSRRGIYEYLIRCDEKNNTSNVIENNEFYAEIYIKPVKSINYITLTFVSTRTGVNFTEIAI